MEASGLPKQDQSDVNLTKWTNDPNNCVLKSPYVPDGRDPTTAWTTDGGKTWTFSYTDEYSYQTTDWRTFTKGPGKYAVLRCECIHRRTHNYVQDDCLRHQRTLSVLISINYQRHNNLMEQRYAFCMIDASFYVTVRI